MRSFRMQHFLLIYLKISLDIKDAGEIIHLLCTRSLCLETKDSSVTFLSLLLLDASMNARVAA